MKIPEDFRAEIVKELQTSAELIRNSDDDLERAYFFSAAYGVLERTIRFHFDPALLFGSRVLRSSYTDINARANQIAAGNDVIPILEEVWGGIAEALTELARRIKSDGDFLDLLQRIGVLTFITSGAGHYMKLRGQIE